MLSNHFQEAIEFSNNEDYLSALPLWQKHLDDIKAADDEVQKFFICFYLSDTLSSLGKLEEAVSLLQQAINVLPKINENEEYFFWAETELCRTLFAQQKDEEAEIIRVTIWNELLQSGGLFDAYNFAVNRLELYPDDFTLLDEVMQQALISENIEFVFHIYQDYAFLLLSQKRFENLLTTSLQVRQFLHNHKDRLPDNTAYICTWLEELEVYYQRREYENLRLTLAEFKQNINFNYPVHKVETSRVLFSEAVLFLIEGELEKAINSLREAQKNAEFSEEFRFKTLEKSYQALTVFHYYDEAFVMSRQALKTAVGFDEYTILDVTIDTAQIYDSANQFSKVIELLLPIENRVLALNDEELTLRFFTLLTTAAEQKPDARIFERARQLWYDFSQGLSDRNIFDFYFEYARLLVNINQTEQALELFEKAGKLIIKLKWQHLLPTLEIERAICETLLNKYEQSYQRLTALSPPTHSLHLHATYLNVLADCQSGLNMIEKAKSNYQKTIILTDKHPFLFHSASAAYSNLGLIEHENKNYFQAEELYHKGLENDIKGGITQQQITAHYNLGVLYIDWDKIPKAEEHLWIAFNLIKKTYGNSKNVSDQKSISDEWFTIIELLVEVYLDKGEETNALRLLLNKNSIFSDLDDNNIASLPLPLLNSTQQLLAYSGIRRERLFIFHLRGSKMPQSLNLSVKKILLDEESESIIPKKIKKSTDTFCRNSLRKSGERDKDYRSSYPWTIRYLHDLCSIPDRELTPRELERQAILFDIFSKILIAPLGEISDLKNLIVAPDYILGSLPFGALFTTAKNDKKLIESFNLSLFGGMIDSSPTDKSNANALVFGATEYPEESRLSNLSTGLTEAENIKKYFPNIISLLDKVSENILDEITSIIEKDNHSHLHFIGHAADSYPESVIYYPHALNGIIPLSEIRKLPLLGKTVYISACLSANGQAYAGWGIDSVARAFLDAGASTVVSLLFPLSDKLSPLLASKIYDEIKSGKSVEIGVSQAQRLCLNGGFGEKYQSVFNWGSLVCVKCLEKFNKVS